MKTALFLLLAVSLSAQMRDNRDKQLSCQNKWDSGRQSRSCNIKEQTISALGRLTVEPGHNGGVTVKGWAQNQTLVRAMVEAWAPSESEASLLAGQVNIETASGILRATGPDSRDNRGWSVSFEVFTPHNTNLQVTAHNGGLNISDINGRIEMKTHNGGVHVSRVAGDITGSSYNGGIHVEMAGAAGQINLETYNGGIHLAVPQNYSARVHAETHNGGVSSDFPMPKRADNERESRPRNIDFTIGGGNATLNVKTHNGGVQIKKT